MKEDGSLAASFAAHDGSKGSAPDLNVGASGGILKMGTESGFAPYEYIADGKEPVSTSTSWPRRQGAEHELQIEDMPLTA